VSGLVRCPACHPERSEGSGEPAAQILRCAQDDMQDTAGGRSREIFSPNVYNFFIVWQVLMLNSMRFFAKRQA